MGKKLLKLLANAKKSIWLFPVVLFIFVCILSFFKLHGSSVGKYNEFLYGQSHQDPNLIFGTPQSIRSDEWLVVTPLTISQANNDFKTINHFIGQGQNMSVVLDVPYKDWSTFFKLQNWAFFVLPLEMAFAFKWWFMGFLLATSCYLFITCMIQGKRLFAVLMSLSLFFTPYIQWWYQSITLLTLAYSFLILTVFIKLTKTRKTKHHLLWTLALTYLTVSFVLIQYPPFQIPCILAMAAFMVGYLLQTIPKHPALRTIIGYSLLATFITTLVGGLYILTRMDVIRTVASTIYPSHREPETFVFSIWHFLTGFLSFQLQDFEHAKNYLANQSEASGFILLTPFLLLPIGYLVFKRRHKDFPWALSLLSGLYALFCIRYFIKLNGSSPAENILLVVQNYRLMLGIGFVGILLTIILAKDQLGKEYPLWLRWGGGLTVFALLSLAGFKLSAAFPDYLNSSVKIISLAFLMAATYVVFSLKRIELAVFILLTINVYSSYTVNPIYRGLSPIIGTELSEKVRELNTQQPGNWVMVHSLQFNTYLAANGINSYSGIYSYPQFKLWRQLDTIPKYKDIYNRYAQAVFSPNIGVSFYLVQPDIFHVKFEPCGEFIQKKIAYALSQSQPESPCLALVDKIDYPKATFYISKVQTPPSQ